MFRWDIVFLAVVLVATTFGLGGLVGIAVDVAKIVLVVGTTLFLVSLFIDRK